MFGCHIIPLREITVKRLGNRVSQSVDGNWKSPVV